MPAETPRPRRFAGRIAEHPHVVQPWIPSPIALELRRPPLQFVENVLEPHDRRHRHVAGTREPGGDQLQGQALLTRAHCRKGQPAMVGRRVEPAAPFFVGWKRPRGERALLRVE